jgi:DNA polymerase III delta prime subunit
MTEVWSQKYRPTRLEDMVGQHQLLSEFDSFLDTEEMGTLNSDHNMQHYLFYSPEAGVGKTTLARIIAEEMGMQLFSYNASTKHERGIDFVENELLPMSRNGNYRQIYLLDEADQLTPAAQSALKGVIENAQGYFILTCNDLSKVSRWLQSRCRTLRFEPIPEDEVVNRFAHIAANEGVVLKDYRALNTIAKAHKGDLRNSINALQAFAGLDEKDGERFLLSLAPQEIDANSFLKSCVAEGDYEKAMTYIGDRPIRQTINSIFSYAVDSKAKPAAKMKVIEAAVQSERDLLIGVDEDIVKHNFVVMCCDTSQLYTGENAERISKQGVLL